MNLFLARRLIDTGKAALYAALCASTLYGQTKSSPPAKSVLQQHYDAAQSYQSAGNLSDAARQYRIFIADALGELAIGRAHLEEYDKAAPLFDEALILAPNSPVLLIEYAQVALTHGDLSRAKSLAEEVLRNYPPNSPAAAKAHLALGRTLLKMNKDQEARKELEAAVALDSNFENGYALAIACLDMEDSQCAARIFSEMQASFGDTAAIHMEFGLAYGQSDFQQMAVTEFKKAIAKNDKLPGAHYSLAATYLIGTQDANIQGAQIELKKELQISPNDFLTYAALGRIAATQSKYDEAEKYLKRAIALNPENPDAYLYLGQMYFATSRWPEAKTALKNAIHGTTDISRNRYQVQKAHYLLGRLLIKSGDEKGGQAEIKTAQAMMKLLLVQDRKRLSGYLDNPAQSDVNSNLATVAFAEIPNKQDAARLKGDRELNAFEQEIAHPVADSYNNLGAIAASAENYTTAVTYFQHAAEWNSSLEGLDYNWGRAAFAAAKFQEAVPPLTRYLNSHPGDQHLSMLLGMAYYGMGDYSAAIPYMKRAAENDPRSLPLRLILAQSCLWSKQYQCVLDVHQEILALNAASAEADMLAGEALDAKGDSAGAIEEFRAAVRANPKKADAHFGLAYLLWAQGQYAEAAKEFQAELVNDPSHLQARAYLGDAYVQLHDYAKAQVELEKAVAADASLAMVHRDLGIAYAELGRKDDAVAELRKAIALNPKDVSSHLRLAKLYQAMGMQEEAKAELTAGSTTNKESIQALVEKISGTRAPEQQ